MDSRPVRFDDVIINAELARRPSRAPRHEVENRALGMLAEVMAESPRTILKRLAESAMELTGAHSAGISIEEGQGDNRMFRWRATAGAYSRYTGGTTSRFFSPCGTVLDRNAALLMSLPVRAYDEISALSPPVVEMLLIPFNRGETPIGTIWIVVHTPEKRFDSEDLRLLESLSRFASAALAILGSVEAAEAADRDLRDARGRLESALEAGAIATWTWDAASDRVAADPNLIRIYSLTPEEAAEGLAATYRRAIHPEDRERVLAAVDESVRTGTHYESEFRVIWPDASCRWVVTWARPVFDPQAKLHSLVGVVVDITDRKRSEERSRLLAEAAEVLLGADEPDAMLRGVFARIAEALGVDTYFNFMVDETGEALRLESCHGIPEAEALRIRRLEFGAAVCGTVALRREAIVATHIQESAEPMVQLVRGYGIRAYACNPLMSRGQLLGTLSFATRTRDEFEPAELEFFRVIASYVATAYVRLELIGRLKQSDRRKDEFLAMLAHELRNPLAAISNAAQLIRQTREKEHIDWSIEVVARQVHHLSRLIDDLMDVSRITRGKIFLRREVMEATSIIESAASTVRSLVEQRGHTLHVEIKRGALWVNADPTRLEQVVVNLLNNAAKYSEDGGWIGLRASVEADSIVIRVEDRGFGIPPQRLPEMFELFAQGDRSLARSEGGLGIGLTIVQKLVEMHGGSVSARSEGPGNGSEFVVRLPLAKRTTEHRSPAADQEDVEVGRRMRILVVDDSVDTAQGMACLLELLGHDVEVVHSGPDAIEAARTHRPQFVLLDIGLPGMTGYDVAVRLREDEASKDACIVAVSGYGQDEDRRRSKASGFDFHLTKPLDHDALLGLLAGGATREG